MEIIEELKNSEKEITKIILSDSKDEVKKIIVRPIEIKGKRLFQVERFIKAQVFHENVAFEDILKLNFEAYKQITIIKFGETLTFAKLKNTYKRSSTKNEVEEVNVSHNVSKNYLINEGDDVPAMVDLGIFTKDGKIVKSMYDKFKQINKFIENIDQEFDDYKDREVTILDFGCGKSYLTFLIYHYFVKIKQIKAKIIGYDIKADVVENCNKIAQKYGYSGLQFVLADVKKDELFKGEIDMIVTLHACDTATDFALDFAIKNKVKHIFSVPCCQHEINLSIKKGGDYDLFFKDGLFKERFSALLTDALRVETLRAKGYSVDVIEFVDFAHSPKNLMIRATLNGTKKSMKNLLELKDRYKFNQTLLDLQK